MTIRKKSSMPPYVILLILCLGLLFQGAGDTHMASFLSEHAEQVGMSTLQYGIIMGVNSVVALTFLPLITKLTMLDLISDKCFLIIGYCIDATSLMAITSLYYLELEGLTFFLALLGLRITQSIGASIGFTLVYSVSGVELPDHSHITVPCLETTYGIGVTLGPAISGALYDAGGFPLPFIYHSSVLFTLVLFAAIFLPKSPPVSEEETTLSLRQIIRPTTLICMMMLATSNIVDTFNDSTLASLLHKFSLSTTAIGLSFFLPAGSFTVSSLVSGFLSNGSNRRLVLLACPILMIVSVVFLAPLVPLPSHPLWLVYVCEVLLGLSIGPVYIYCYLLIHNDLSTISDNKSAHTATAAVNNWSAFLGAFIGPVMGNYIIEKSSYHDAALTVALITAAVSFIYSVFTIRMHCRPQELKSLEELEDEKALP